MLTAALVSCASCSTSEPAEISDGGPMIVNVGSGGFAFAEPKHRGLWTGTFGALRLCNKAPGVESRVLKVIPDVTLKPAKLALWTRTVGPGEKHDNFASALGSPPAWREAYADRPRGGTWTRGVSGLKIRQSCADANGDDDYTELVFVMTSDTAGAKVRSARVVYSAGGRRYSTGLPWHMVLCGDAPKVHDDCNVP